MENRLGLPSQSATANYAVVDRRTLDPVFRFRAVDRDQANRTYGEWLAAAGLPTTTEDYGFQEIRPQPSQIPRDWRIVDRETDETLNTVRGASQDQALAVRDDTARRHGVDARQLSLQVIFNPDAAQQEIPEVPMDVAQNFPDRTDGRNINFGNQFSGQWRVMLDGEEVWRFRGVGNNQADANRIAQLWLQDQRSQGLLSPAPGADIEVVPVMTESVQQHVRPVVAEGKVKLHTDPGYFGAEVDDTGFDSLPVVNIPTNQLVGFEPDSKMNQPKSKVNVEKIVAGLRQGAKLPPLLVRKYKNGYQVLDGHHRFWAYKLLGVKSIPSRIVPDEDIEEISKQGVAEGNLHRGIA
jgi:hypothetical protein